MSDLMSHDAIMDRMQRGYNELLSQVQEMKDLMRALVCDYAGEPLPHEDHDPTLKRIWQILDEDREPYDEYDG